MPPVIAISGPPGSGKSTLATALAERLGAALLSYDDYEEITGRSPRAIEAWLAGGAPLAEVAVPGLREDLLALRAGAPVRHRPAGRAGRGGGAVVHDTLVGRAHPATADLVDFMIWIETPLDVALARKLRRVVGAVRGRRDLEGLQGWLETYLGHYEGFVRRAYLLQRDRIAPGADLTLDGLDPAADLADRAAFAIRDRLLSREPS